MRTHQDRSTASDTSLHQSARSDAGHCITRAVPSGNGIYIAAIASASQIHISRCNSDQGSVLWHVAEVHSRQVQKVLAQAHIFRWAPQSYSIGKDDAGEIEPEDHLLRAWLMVSDGHRLVLLCIDMDLQVASEAACTILAEYDLGTQLGTSSFVDLAGTQEYAIILRNAGIQACIISLTRPERHDISNIKYPDSRGLAKSPNGKCFSALTRSEGQDLVVVFTTTEMGSIKSNSFASQTYDAQGIKWCPEGDPLLCVWDSAAFGLRVLFFTANGHHLKQLDMTAESLRLFQILPGFEGLGISKVDWLLCNDKAVLAVIDSSGNLFLRRQLGYEKLRPSVVTINHHTIINGASYDVWQESPDGDHMFSRHMASFQARNVQGSAGADKVAVNAICQLVALKDSSRPWTLWIWDILSTEQPLAVVNFRDRIKQLLWHPKDPDLLVILTATKEPYFHLWHARSGRPLISNVLTVSSSLEMSDCEAAWLAGHLNGSPLLFLSWPRHYDAGIINIDQDSVIFQGKFRPEHRPIG